MDLPIRTYTTQEYRLIAKGNLKICKKFFPNGTSNIVLNPMTVVEKGVLIRGDLNKVSIGGGTILDEECILSPSLNKDIPPFEYNILKIGNNSYIGKNTIIKATIIGNNVFIGNNSIIV
jgi:dynactin-5